MDVDDADVLRHFRRQDDAAGERPQFPLGGVLPELVPEQASGRRIAFRMANLPPRLDKPFESVGSFRKPVDRRFQLVMDRVADLVRCAPGRDPQVEAFLF